MTTQCHALFENAMGHRSYARSLATALSADPLIRIDWNPVSYDIPPGVPRSNRFFPLHVGLNARSVLSSLDLSRTDCLLFHTHWVAAGALGRRLPPHVVSLDATPSAYDAADSRVAPRTRATLRSRPLRSAVHRALSRAGLVVALSEWTAQQLVDHEKVPEDRIRVVFPGVDTSVFFPRPRDPQRVRITFVGYDFDRKGGQRLLEWAATTKVSGWELHLVSPNAPASLPPRVFAHRSTRDAIEVAELLGSSDIFTLPSGQDIVPVAVIEALASGCAVVATSLGAIPDLLDHGGAGALISPGSTIALHAALDDLVRDTARRRELSAAGRARAVAHYDIAKTSLTMRSALLDAASGR